MSVSQFNRDLSNGLLGDCMHMYMWCSKIRILIKVPIQVPLNLPFQKAIDKSPVHHKMEYKFTTDLSTLRHSYSSKIKWLQIRPHIALQSDQKCSKTVFTCHICVNCWIVVIFISSS